jgi:hypothetical protein
LGIAGTKGQLVLNQAGTVANTLAQGVSGVLQNNNDALQNVVRHVQTIFNSNNGVNVQSGPNTQYGAP